MHVITPPSIGVKENNSQDVKKENIKEVIDNVVKDVDEEINKFLIVKTPAAFLPQTIICTHGR